MRYTLAVMDATETARAGIVSLSLGSQWALELCARHPNRITAAAFIAPTAPLAPPIAGRIEALETFDQPRDSYEGWFKFNRHYWHQDYAGFADFFFREALVEPHSTKQLEDCIGWALETTAATLVLTKDAPRRALPAESAAARSVSCPVLVVHGDADGITPHACGVALAELTKGTLLTLHGSGHMPHARDPVKINQTLREFFEGPPKPKAWHRASTRRKRALFISSPIGLGHARRDVAIARELRKLHPDLEVDWLAQHPVTKLLEETGERIHPASAALANESAHFEDECGEHDLQCFEALRRMDEIMVANFMIFADLVRDEHYDLWIGDEAWEIDHFLHENPEAKRAPYVWLTDFVGYLPMPGGGPREAALTADYNAEMIGHIERFPAVRDRALFVGNADDVVREPFGPGLPAIRDWTERHYDFCGYVTGFDAEQTRDRERLRARFGYGPHEKIAIVTVGGSGVGTHLLRRIVAAYPTVKRQIPQLRMVVVAGPRIAPASIEAPPGVEVHAYVPRLYERLAACDLALVQGGLTTTMELTAAGRPFLYFPLRNHFEQNWHVRHRLEQYGAGRRMEYHEAGPALIAQAMAEELTRQIAYRAVESDGAAKAAEFISALFG